MPYKYYQKTKQDSEKKHVKYIKIFLKKKKTKSRERYQNYSEEEKEKEHQYYR